MPRRRSPGTDNDVTIQQDIVNAVTYSLSPNFWDTLTHTKSLCLRCLGKVAPNSGMNGDGAPHGSCDQEEDDVVCSTRNWSEAFSVFCTKLQDNKHLQTSQRIRRLLMSLAES